MREALLQSVYRTLTSREAVFWSAATLVVVAAFGLVVPQGLAASDVAASYPPAIAQVVTALDLHRLPASWLLQLPALLLGLAVLGRLLQAGTPRSLRTGLLWAAGGLLTAGGVLLGWQQGGGAFRGRIEVVSGNDELARGEPNAWRLEGDRWVPWTPPFRLWCERPQGVQAPRPQACTVVTQGRRYRVRFERGRRVVVGGLRLTPTAVIPDASLAPFHLQLVSNTGVASVPVQPGEAVDVPPDADPPGLTLLVTGAHSGDPLGVLLGPRAQSAPAPNVVLPRLRIRFDVRREPDEWWVWGGLSLLLGGIGLGAALAWTHREVPA